MERIGVVHLFPAGFVGLSLNSVVSEVWYASAATILEDSKAMCRMDKGLLIVDIAWPLAKS